VGILRCLSWPRLYLGSCHGAVTRVARCHVPARTFRNQIWDAAPQHRSNYPSPRKRCLDRLPLGMRRPIPPGSCHQRYPDTHPPHSRRIYPPRSILLCAPPSYVSHPSSLPPRSLETQPPRQPPLPRQQRLARQAPSHSTPPSRTNPHRTSGRNRPVPSRFLANSPPWGVLLDHHQCRGRSCHGESFSRSCR
jgi:hypothetical protein